MSPAAPSYSPNNNDVQMDTHISKLNIVNVLAFVFNIVITFGIGTLGWTGRPGNGELSLKYQTLVTPWSTAFIIWSVIFVLQGLWVILTLLLPRQRHNTQVVTVGYNYLWTCLAQVGWTLAFSYEIIWLSFVFMLLILFFLMRIVHDFQTYVKNKNWKLYFLWQFPFSIHAGWILAASAVNLNVVLVAYGASTTAQLAIASLSLVILFLASLLFLRGTGPDLTPNCVLAWALGGIYAELENPADSIVARFTVKQIQGIQYAAIAGAALILALTLTKAGLEVRRLHREKVAASNANQQQETSNNNHSVAPTSEGAVGVDVEKGISSDNVDAAETSSEEHHEHATDDKAVTGLAE